MFQRTMNNSIESAIFVKFNVSINFTVALNKINEALTTFCRVRNSGSSCRQNQPKVHPDNLIFS